MTYLDLFTGVSCGPPLDIEGTVQHVTSDTFQGNVTYECQQEYKWIGGNLTRICQSNKKWSGTAPTCQCELGWILVTIRISTELLYTMCMYA